MPRPPTAQVRGHPRRPLADRSARSRWLRQGRCTPCAAHPARGTACTRTRSPTLASRPSRLASPRAHTWKSFCTPERPAVAVGRRGCLTVVHAFVLHGLAEQVGQQRLWRCRRAGARGRAPVVHAAGKTLVRSPCAENVYTAHANGSRLVHGSSSCGPRSLAGNRISDTGVQALAAALPACSRLNWLR